MDTNKVLKALWAKIEPLVSKKSVPDRAWDLVRSITAATGCTGEEVLRYASVKRQRQPGTGLHMLLDTVMTRASELKEWVDTQNHGTVGKQERSDEETTAYTYELDARLRDAVKAGYQRRTQLLAPIYLYDPWFRILRCDGDPEIIDMWRDSAIKESRVNDKLAAEVMAVLNEA